MTTSRPHFNAIDRWVRRLRLRPIRAWIHTGDRVIDVGCGTENWLIRNLEACATDSIGVDPFLPADLVGAQGVRGDISEVASKQPDSFDVATSLAVIEHLEPADRDLMLANIRRLLRPAGRLLLTTPSPRSRWLLELLAFRLHIISEHEIRDHKQYYSLDDLRSLLTAAGLTVEVARTFQFGLNQLLVATRHPEGTT